MQKFRTMAIRALKDTFDGLKSNGLRLGSAQEREVKFSKRDLMCEEYGYFRGGQAASMLEIALDLENETGAKWLRDEGDEDVLVFLCQWKPRIAF